MRKELSSCSTKAVNGETHQILKQDGTWMKGGSQAELCRPQLPLSSPRCPLLQSSAALGHCATVVQWSCRPLPPPHPLARHLLGAQGSPQLLQM